MMMTKAEVFDEIRALLREPKIESVSNPWNYTDGDLTIQVVSALRNLRVNGVSSLTDVSVDVGSGEFNRTVTEAEGVLISLFVAQRLISGDLIQKLLDGELGIYLNAGGDVIDSKTATRAFMEVADTYRTRTEILTAVAIASSPSAGGAAAYFGEQFPYMA